MPNVPIETPLGPLQTLDDLTAAVAADPGVARRLACPVLVMIAPMDMGMRTTDVKGGQVRPGVTMLPAFVVRVTGAGGGLAKRPLLMGRAAEADIPLAFSALSKQHARFIPGADGGWSVEDIGSRNGIFLEGTRIELNKPARLNDGCKLRFGNMVGRFVLPGTFGAELLSRASQSTVKR